MQMKATLNKQGIDLWSVVSWWVLAFPLMALLVAVSGAVIWGYEQIVESTLNRKASSYWGEYYSVSPKKPSFKVGEKIQFLSDSVVYRGADVRWLDTLNCKDNGEGAFHFFYTVADSAYLAPRGRKVNAWNWNGIAPGHPTECYLRSVITYTDPKYGTRKTQIVQDKLNSFLIVP